jgi:ferritin-like metal-binding protein YciE
MKAYEAKTDDRLSLLARMTTMSNLKLREKLVEYLHDAHAMEQNVLRMLDSMISMTNHEATLNRLLEHRKETERHERLLGRNEFKSWRLFHDSRVAGKDCR